MKRQRNACFPPREAAFDNPFGEARASDRSGRLSGKREA